MGKLSQLGEEAVSGAGRVWQTLLMKLGMEGVLQAGLGSDVHMQCMEVLERFEQVGGSMSRDYEVEVKRQAGVMDKLYATVDNQREVTRQALASLSHRKEKEHHDGLAGQAAAILHGGVEGARRKALKNCEAYQKVIDSSNVVHHQLHSHDLPTLLTQMQSLEEMRLQSLHTALSTFSSLHSSHGKAVVALSGDIKSLVQSVQAEADIREFISRTIQQHGPPLPSQPFYYDCSITPNELRQEIEAEDKVSQSSTSEKLRPSLFYTSLEGVMEYERARFEEKKEVTAASPSYPPDIPRILPVLIAAIERLGGPTSEGIFRLSVSTDELHAVRKTLERGDYLLSSIDNPHVPAAVLKAWLRDLSSPLIPFSCYDRAIELGKLSPAQVFDAPSPNPLSVLLQSIPSLNRRVLLYLLTFLHRLTLPPWVEQSRMTQSNLAVVFSPTLLRSEGNEAVVMMRDSKWGCAFIALLMECVGRGVGWEEERQWKAKWEAKAVGLQHRGSVPPPVPAEYLSPHTSPPPSPGLVGGRVHSGMSFADQHAVHAPHRAVGESDGGAGGERGGLPQTQHTKTALSSECEALPLNWLSRLDPASGVVYYFNSVTGESQWTHP